MAWLTAISVALSILASLLIVPAVRKAARMCGIVDHPDSDRKLHLQPVALGGGLAVFLALTAAVAGTVWVDRELLDGVLGTVTSQWYILLGAAAAMLAVGLIDDVWSLRGRQKLLLQCLIIAALVGSGTLIDELSLLGFEFSLGMLAFPVTVVWLLLSVNALNLIDGADGMATTAGCIICAGLGFISLRGAHASLSADRRLRIRRFAAGFLVYNRPPASIYLGDAGSMAIGLCVGVLAVWSSVKETTVLASAPVAILAIPLFDSSAAILRRWLTGRSIYASDRAHLHHLLQERFGPVKMLFIVAALCTTTTALSVLSVIYRQPWLAALGVMIVMGLLILTRSFGHAEFRLLMGSAAHFAQSFTTTPRDKHHRRFSLQGVGCWEKVWEPLVDFAKTHEMAKLKIDLNLSWIHEGYHATWQSTRLPDKEFQLSMCVPLFTHRGSDQIQVPIGRLEIIAPANDPTVYERIADLTDRLADLAPQIDGIVAELEALRRSTSAANPSERLSDGAGVRENDPSRKTPITNDGRSGAVTVSSM